MPIIQVGIYNDNVIAGAHGKAETELDFFELCRTYCEAQGKGRAKARPLVTVTQRSFIDGGWWLVDILSLMLYIKFGCHHHQKSHYPQD